MSWKNAQVTFHDFKEKKKQFEITVFTFFS